MLGIEFVDLWQLYNCDFIPTLTPLRLKLLVYSKRFINHMHENLKS